MKLSKLFAAFMLIGAVALTACHTVPEDPDGPGKPGKDTTVVVNSDTLTVAQAISKQDNSIAYVKGYIVGWYSNHNNDKAAIFSAEGTADTTVLATNVVIADATSETVQANCVCVQLPTGALRSALNLKDHPENLHAVVVLHGTLTSYNTMAGLKTIDAASLNGIEISTSVDVSNAIEATCSEVAAIASALAPGASTTEYYKVAGTVSAVATAANNLVSYGNINFTLQDESGVIGCYYINYLNNEKFTSESQILNPGDKVVVVSQLKNYEKNGSTSPEMANGFLLSVEKGQISDEVTDKTLAEIVTLAGTLSTGATTLEKYRATGIVSKVNTAVDKLVGYGNCNFIITDGTNNVTCYYTNWLNNTAFTSTEDIPVVGDTVTVVGPVQNYNGTAEFYKGYIEVIKRGNGATPEGGDTGGSTTDDIDIPAGAIIFDATTDLGSITDYNNAGADQVTKNGITIAITNGCLGLGLPYRIYKNATMTIAAESNIESITLVCEAENDAKWGPGSATAASGTYTYSGKIGQWVGNATSVVFTATNNQIRCSKIAVVLASAE